MFTEGVLEILAEAVVEYDLWEAIDERGWLDKRDKKIEAVAAQKTAQKTAQKLLLRGLSIEDVAEDTELPLDMVIAIANQLQELPAGV